MQVEKIEMLNNQEQQIANMLQKQGLTPSEINEILNGEYESYDSKEDLEKSFSELRKHEDVLEKLSDGYTMDELQAEGISKQKIDDFNKMLAEKNITVDNAKAIYQYSVGSNMILGVKRGESKEKVQEQIMSDLEKSLKERGIDQDSIDKMKQFVKDSDYGKTTLHDNYDRANGYMELLFIQELSIKKVLELIVDNNNMKIR